MSYKMFIDDLRECPNGFVCCRSSNDAIAYVMEHGCPIFISFDHDLGGDDTSILFVNWLIDAVLDGKVILPSEFDYKVHSANPIGAMNIKSKMDGFLKFVRE